MIGTRPSTELAPLDYRYALDAAMSFVAGATSIALVCHTAQLMEEALQRIGTPVDLSKAQALFWIDPLHSSWRAELEHIRSDLPLHTPLIIVVSQALARVLPERRGWPGQPLGMRPAGLWQLRRALSNAGLQIEARYGVHSVSSILRSRLSHALEQRGRADLADRVLANARLHYLAHPPFTSFATVALLVARRAK